MWITSTGEGKKFQSGLLLQGFSLIVLHGCYRREIIGPDFDVGRVSRFQCGLLHETSPQLFCADITRGEDSCNRGKEFLCSNVDFYIRTTSSLFCTDFTHRQ